MTTRSRLNVMAHRLQWATVLVLAALPLALVAVVAAIPFSPAAWTLLRGAMPIPASAGSGQVIAALLVGMIGPVVLWLTLNEMRKLFAAYSAGDVFSSANATIIRRIGFGFVALAVVPLFTRPLQTVMLTMANPPGQRSIAISIETDMIFFAIAGGLIMLIGWAMSEAAAIAAENRAFV